MAEQTWLLAVITSEGEFENIATGDLDSMLHPEGPVLHGIAGDDREMAGMIVADLKRWGARYSEFIGGTVVLAAVEIEQ